MLTIYEDAHNLRKYSQLTKMLTTCENPHNLRKCSQLTKMLITCENAHNLRKYSQLAKMLTTCQNAITTCEDAITTCKNAHNREPVLQLAKMLTSFNKMLTAMEDVLPLPPRLTAERLQHLTPAKLHLSQPCEAVPIANGHAQFSMAEKGHSILLYCHSARPVELNRDLMYTCLIVQCWDSIPNHV